MFLLSLFFYSIPETALALSSDLSITLSSDEKNWLAANQNSIRYAPNPSWPPGDYVENGIHKGIVSDYIRIFEEKLGVKFQRTYFNKWHEIISALKNADTDFAGAIQETEERKQHMLFTRVFLKTHLSVIIQQSSPDDFAAKLNSATLACPRGYTTVDYVRSTYPGAKLIDDVDDLGALLKVSVGAADGAVVDFMVASYLIEKYGITNLKFGMELDYCWNLSFACRKSMPEFCSILDKTLATISDEEKQQIYRKWVGLGLDKSPSFLERHKWSVIGVFSFIIAGLFVTVFFVVLLKQKVNERTENLVKLGNMLKESKEYLQSVLDSCGDAVFVHDAGTGDILDVNNRMCEMYGYTREEALQTRIDALSENQQPYTQVEAGEWLRKSRESGPQTFEWRARHKDGHCFWAEVSACFTKIGDKNCFVVVVRDIDKRKKSEEEHIALNARLFQAQKMETIGQLAGGVAHDFNNMLSVITGYTELSMSKVSRDSVLHDNLKEVLTAAERAAGVTRQLLGFARKQSIAPRHLDVNVTIEQTLKMLRRLIGENIKLNWQPHDAPLPVYIDPSQLNQILVNLCINARDAIEDVGQINIKTGKASFDEEYCAEHAGSAPGDYVMIELSDNGCGMTEKTLSRIFEPFFTTKEPGKGTGLGMSMIYGIVDQNHGFIDVQSEPGNGSVFKIYLPYNNGVVSPVEVSGEELSSSSRKQNLLIVEDEEAILELISRLLKDLGYNIMAASLPVRAIELANEHTGQIDLLITDVMMPEMSGPDLAKKLLKSHARMKVLYISGYAADKFAQKGLMENDAHFLQKPFTCRELTAKVDEIFNPSPAAS